MTGLLYGRNAALILFPDYSLVVNTTDRLCAYWGSVTTHLYV